MLFILIERLLQEAERVEVLDLGLRAERRRARRPHRDVGVAAQAALFHVAVVDAEPDEDLAQAAEERRGVGGRSQVGLGDDLDERHAAAVEVDVGLAIGIGEALVQRLAGVLFHVDARDADAHGAVAARARRRRRSRAAARTARSDSPSAGPDRSSSCARRSTSSWIVQPSASAARIARSTARAVQHRQRARQAETHRADVRVRRARRTRCCSRRRSSWRSAAARGSRGR